MGFDDTVVYLNGTELVHSNMPTGTIDYLTYASSTSPSRPSGGAFGEGRILGNFIAP